MQKPDYLRLARGSVVNWICVNYSGLKRLRLLEEFADTQPGDRFQPVVGAKEGNSALRRYYFLLNQDRSPYEVNRRMGDYLGDSKSSPASNQRTDYFSYSPLASSSSASLFDYSQWDLPPGEAGYHYGGGSRISAWPQSLSEPPNTPMMVPQTMDYAYCPTWYSQRQARPLQDNSLPLRLEPVILYIRNQGERIGFYEASCKVNRLKDKGRVINQIYLNYSDLEQERLLSEFADAQEYGRLQSKVEFEMIEPFVCRFDFDFNLNWPQPEMRGPTIFDTNLPDDYDPHLGPHSFMSF